MKRVVTLAVALLFLLNFFTFGQIDPDARGGIFLNFEEEDNPDVDPLDVEGFECDDTPVFEAVANPDPTSPPTTGWYNSSNVGQITTTACTNEGIRINNEFLIDFTEHPWISLDVISPAADRRVVLRLEVFDNSSDFVEAEDTTTVDGGWETLTFDFSGQESGKYGRIVLMPDYEGTTAGDVWIFDNIRQDRPPIGYKDGLLVDFETKSPWWNYWNVDFDVVENPDPSGINISPTVGYFYTTDEGITWEGATPTERYYPFDFTDGTTFSLQVYAPEEGRIVLFKIESFLNNTDNPIEIQATTTTAYQWEELTYDFGDNNPESGFYDRIVVFPDFNANTIDEEWYFDNIYFHGTLTGTNDKMPGAPAAYQLHATNYPNPFNPVTTISYEIPVNTEVRLAVYDILGREIAVLVNESQAAGTYTKVFNASQLSSGVYVYRLTAGKNIFNGKMLLIK